MIDVPTEVQLHEHKGHKFRLIGDLQILEQNLCGVLCSQSCPGELILQAFDTARQLREDKQTVISGFHSPIELEMFSILLRGKQPIVLCLARNIASYQISKAFKILIGMGQLALIAPNYSAYENRITQETANLRNSLIFQISDQVLLIHAKPGGDLERICLQYLPDNENIYALPSERNSHLFEKGVLQWETKKSPSK